MNERIKDLFTEIEKNPELKKKLQALPDEDASKDKAIEIAKEYGFVLTREDLEGDINGEISNEELMMVAGGLRMEDYARDASGSGFVLTAIRKALM